MLRTYRKEGNSSDASKRNLKLNKTCFCKTLAFRLFASLILIFVIIFTIIALVLIEQNKSQIFEIVKNNIIRTGDIIKRSTRYSMLLNRREDVYQIIKTIGNEPEVEAIRVYNKQGIISFAENDSIIHKKVEVSSVECIHCHIDGNSIAKVNAEEMTRIFTNSKGQKIIGLIIPIENEKDCSSADCHAHPEQQRILGILDVQMSLASVENFLSQSTKSLIRYLVLTTIIISLFSGIFIWLMVHLRVNVLIKGINAIAEGDYDYRIMMKAGDELGELSRHFNGMAENLKKALTEIKELNENLNVKVQEKTEQLKEIYNHVSMIERMASLGKLSATVAHEINNPLEGILTYSKLIIKKLQSNEVTLEEKEKIIKYLNLIATETERCGNIVKNLLLFSKSGERTISNNDLIGIVENSLMLIEHHLQLNNIKLVKDFCCNYLEFECDRNQIEQTILAILINAIEAMPDGGTLSIKVDCENGVIKIKISDTGVGIPKENLDKIFEPFFSTKSNGKGTGLGLSVVYGIVKQHQGKINIESEVNVGTTVTLSFPKKITAME